MSRNNSKYNLCHFNYNELLEEVQEFEDQFGEIKWVPILIGIVFGLLNAYFAYYWIQVANYFGKKQFFSCYSIFIMFEKCHNVNLPPPRVISFFNF